MSTAYDNGYKMGLVQGRYDGRKASELEVHDSVEQKDREIGWAAGYAAGYTEEHGFSPSGIPAIPAADGGMRGGKGPG